MKKERIGTWVLVLLFVCATLAWAGVRHNKDNMKFSGAVEFGGVSGVTVTTPMACTETASFAEPVTFTDVQYSGVTTYDTTSGVTYALIDDYKYVIVLGNATSNSGLTMPPITRSGQEVVFKLDAGGTSVFTIVPYDPSNAGEAIESAKGTLTGDRNVQLDAAGEVLHFVSYYVSGSTSYWYNINADF